MPSKSFDAVVNFTALSRVRVGRHLAVCGGRKGALWLGHWHLLWLPPEECGGRGACGCVVRLPGIGREKLTARTNKEKTYAMRPVRRTLHTLQYVKLNNPIRYSQLN